MSRSVYIALIGFVVAAAAVVMFLAQKADDAAEPQQAAQQVASPENAASVVVPSFDVVRIGERGDTVMAGRAHPRAEVLILDSGREIGRVGADERGEWVFVPTEAMAPGTRQLTIEAHHPDTTVTRSAETVILLVPDRAGDHAIAMKPRSGGGVTLLQGPLSGNSELSIDIVDQQSSGLFVGGRAQVGAWVLLYLDNRLIGRSQSDGDGGWSISARAPKQGTSHTLRADRIDSRGRVLSRVEIPYDATVDVVAPGTVLVQPGQSLWRIARQMYGSGPAFTTIFKANKDRIRDPDVIYPGQVFNVPER